MTTEVEAICAAFKTIGDLISGVKAYNPPPPKLDTAILPALYALTGPATYDESQGSGKVSVTRVFRVQVPVLPVGQGTPNEWETRARPLLDNVAAELRKFPHLHATAGTYQAQLLGDTGIVQLPDYGGEYIGFEIRVQVTMIIKRSYHAGD